MDKFEDIAKKQDLGLDVVFQFPTYGKCIFTLNKTRWLELFYLNLLSISGFCQSADKEHTLGKSNTFLLLPYLWGGSQVKRDEVSHEWKQKTDRIYRRIQAHYGDETLSA